MPKPPDEPQRPSDVTERKVKSAVRTVELLEYFASRQERPARIREICAALDMPRSSAHALLRTLMAQGCVGLRCSPSRCTTHGPPRTRSAHRCRSPG